VTTPTQRVPCNTTRTVTSTACVSTCLASAARDDSSTIAVERLSSGRHVPHHAERRHLDRQKPISTPLLTQDQRLAWIKELLTGDVESLPYRVAGTLLLLYAQPLVRIAALTTMAVDVTHGEVQISLGAEPVPVPGPFADMLTDHLRNRTNLRTGAGMVSNPWLFPGRNAGKHLDPQTMQMRLHNRSISVLGARNSALQNLVAEIPPPVMANLLGYSHTCTQYHAQLAAQPWSRYFT
jgi:hypothetical protein